MEEIFVDKAINANNVKVLLGKLFPKLNAFQWFPRDGDVNPLGFNRDEPTHILFDIYEENYRLEFWWRLSLYGPQEGHEERERFVAKYLSKTMCTRTLVSYQLPSEDKYPYYNIVYDNGICYLADDSMFDWSGEADELSEPIKIVRPIELLDAKFDAFGKLMK